MQAWIEVLIKSSALFFVMFFLIRLVGKRSVAHMKPFNLVSYIVVAAVTALVITGVVGNLVLGLVALGVWILLLAVTDYLAMQFKWAHDIVYGKETVLIKHGKIMEENLKRTRLTGEDLLRALRMRNAFNLADVEFAVMEATGDISVYLKSDRKPVTAHDMGIKTSPQAEPQTIILDGNILDEPLASLGLNREWLGVKLESMGVSLDNVTLGQVDSSGDLYVDLFDDSIALPQPKVREMLYATLEKCQADLAGFSLETENTEAKEMYDKNAGKLKQLTENLRPYLLR